MINTFEQYLKLGKVKKQTPNPEESKALFEKSKLRLDYSKDKTITEQTASFVLEDAYEALRESAQSLMAKDGYKPYSHEATISFIKTYYASSFNEQEFALFDRFRQLRHNSVYNASPVTREDAQLCVRFASTFILKIEKIIKDAKKN